jgi:hypothetical protein
MAIFLEELDLYYITILLIFPLMSSTSDLAWDTAKASLVAAAAFLSSLLAHSSAYLILSIFFLVSSSSKTSLSSSSDSAIFSYLVSFSKASTAS